MCRTKFHKYCNCQYEPSEKKDNYIINYVNSLSRKKRKGLLKISLERPTELDFYYHLNGKTHLSDYYYVNVWYRYKKAMRCYGFKLPLETFD